MQKLVECVPNISEGRNQDIIDKVVSAAESVNGVTVLDVDPGADTNRTVITMVGSPANIQEGAFQLVKRASELIDMSKHKGAHARMGATDVCPFVPVQGVTMDDCVEIAKAVGKRIGEELKIPIYLYEYAASKPEWKNLANIRQGEYEALEEKLKDPYWKPDFGKSEFNKKSGATAVGAREFLIAYNINLNTGDKNLAHKEIALNIREKGRRKRDEKGKVVRDENGKIVQQPGTLKECKAVGWYIEEYGQAQISMNLTNFNVTPPHIAFDEVCKWADKAGLRVTGSELVGLMPLEAIVNAGKYYYEKQNRSAGVPEKDLIDMAIKTMGLSDITPFDPEDKIIEYRVRGGGERLVDLQTTDFVDETSRDSVAPGGGSVAALCGSLSAALSSMVANITSVKKGYEEHSQKMKDVGVKLQELKEGFVTDIDRDTDAFNEIMAAFRVPKDERKQAVENATKNATLIPLGVLKRSVETLEIVKYVTENGFDKSISDVGVAGWAGLACAQGAFLNVKINTLDIEDEIFVKKCVTEGEEAIKKVEELNKLIQKRVKDVMDNS